MIRPSSTRPIFKIDKSLGAIAPSAVGQVVTVTVNQAVGQADPTTALPIRFDVVFNAPVTGFTAGDVVIGGTAGATTCVVTGSGALYTIAVTPPAAGTVNARIPAGVAIATHNGNPNEASTWTDNEVTYVPFAVTINQASGQADPTSSSPILFDVVFNEPVTGFTSADVIISGTAGAASCVVTGSGANYTVSVPMVSSAPPGVPSSLLDVGSLDHFNLSSAWGIAIYGNYAVISATGGSYLTLVDLTPLPATPTFTGTIQDPSSLNLVFDVAIYGTHAVAGSSGFARATTVSLATPASPTVADFVQDGTNLISPRAVAVHGDYAIFCDNLGDQITSVLLSTPTNLTVADTVTHANLDQPVEIAIDGNIAAVVMDGAQTRLMTVDVSDPTNLSVRGSVSHANLGTAWDVATHDGVAYVVASGGSSLLTSVDITPTTPVILDTLVNGAFSNPRAVALYQHASGLYAIVACNPTSLLLVNCSDPSNLTGVAALTISTGSFRKMAIYGEYILLTSASGNDLRVARIELA